MTSHVDTAAAPSAARPLRVAIAGNPNAGKTSLFNALTGLRGKVSNYPGVTVEQRSHVLELRGTKLELIDVPGTYSLSARSPEEQIAIEQLLGLRGAGRVDAVIVCVDATQVVRASYLVLQCLELGVPTVVALTMIDEAKQTAPDAPKLAAALGCPVVPVVARFGVGLDDLVQQALDLASISERRARFAWQPSAMLATAIAAVTPLLPTVGGPTARALPARNASAASLPASAPHQQALALWALASIDTDDELADIPPTLRQTVLAYGDQLRAFDDEVVGARWAYLRGHVAPLVRASVPAKSRQIDRVLLHPLWGMLAFLAFMTLVFTSLFSGAAPVMDFINAQFANLGDAVKGVAGDGLLGAFLSDGVIAGVGAVVVFLPQIVLLFLFLGFLEDCGYMARVAFLIDRIMRALGLHGKAFVPMLSGFACAIPAIMATRTIESRRDRLLTMMVIPLMTCSARLPVYTLVIAALIPSSMAVKGMMMAGMYAFSIVMTLVVAFVMSKTLPVFKGRRLPFVISFPSYRWPRPRDVLRMMWDRSWSFLSEAGSRILVASLVLWVLLSFPRTLPSDAPHYDDLIANAPSAEAKAEFEHQKATALLEHSFAGRIGKAMEPAIAPLGFDWKIGIGLVGAFAAREVFVSTMGVVFAIGDDADEENVALRDALTNAKHSDGKPRYTVATGLSLMVFFALACQCLSTLAAFRRESGSRRWTALLFVYMTALAWVMSFIVYQLARCEPIVSQLAR